MASRRVCCRWCGVPYHVPIDAQTLSCPACRRITVFQSNNSGFLPSGGRGNINPMFIIANAANPGRVAIGRPHQPTNMVRVQEQPQLYAPPPHGRKRAVLCGINYKGHEQSLSGSINDVLYMKKLLIERFGFPHASILMLTEEEDYTRFPTKRNIRSALRWLVQGCQHGDSLVFHYSGHGSQVRDHDGDELDGFDEALLPVDYLTEGRILDDELNATIVRPLPKGATLHSIIDTCFSGTFLDLPNVCRINREGYYKWEDHCIPHAGYKGTSGGVAICISACDDHQSSGDTTAFTGAATGALTYSFVQTLEREPNFTYGNLLIVMRKRITAARQEVGLNSTAPHLSQIVAPPYAHAIQCTVCQTIVHVQPNDLQGQAHNSICRAASRVKDKLRTASSNINMMVTTINNNSGSTTSGSAHDPQQARPSPSLIPVSTYGRKRAVLCGVSYYGQRYSLKGTVNDVNCMRYFLTQKLGFPSDSILVLTEEESDPLRIPTKFNIRHALQWLVQGSQSGDSLVFHFSGHGSQQHDFDGDELDGYDETLWPVDHQSEGKILDDEINDTIVRPLPRGAKLHAIIDACHSGTILDLPFLCRMNRNGSYMWKDQGSQSAIYKGTKGGLAISFSACDDDQVSVDTTALTGNIATGAMTYSFIQAAQNEPGLTYGRLLNAMRQIIRESETRYLPTGPASLLKKVVCPILPQEPQLSSSEKFDIYTKQFVL